MWDGPLREGRVALVLDALDLGVQRLDRLLQAFNALVNHAHPLVAASNVVLKHCQIVVVQATPHSNTTAFSYRLRSLVRVLQGIARWWYNLSGLTVRRTGLLLVLSKDVLSSLEVLESVFHSLWVHQIQATLQQLHNLLRHYLVSARRYASSCQGWYFNRSIWVVRVHSSVLHILSIEIWSIARCRRLLLFWDLVFRCIWRNSYLFHLDIYLYAILEFWGTHDHWTQLSSYKIAVIFLVQAFNPQVLEKVLVDHKLLYLSKARVSSCLDLLRILTFLNNAYTNLLPWKALSHLILSTRRSRYVLISWDS